VFFVFSIAYTLCYIIFKGYAIHADKSKGYAVKKSLRTPALDHNFCTQNPSMSYKVSKDSDCSLVSNKNQRITSI